MTNVVGLRDMMDPRSLGMGAAAERMVRASAWAGRTPAQRAWVVEGWLPAGSTTVLYGDGGTGKSLLAQQLATAVVAGSPFLGLPVRQGGALALFCEDDLDELHRRQAAINAALGVGYGALDELLIVSTIGEDSTLFKFEPGIVTGAPTEFGVGFASLAAKAALIIIDTAADTFAGKEIDRYQVRQFVTWLNAIAKRTGAAVVLLAHPSLTGMASGRGQSGSTAWTNGARSHLYLEHDAAEGDALADSCARRLSRKKANYAAKGDTLRLTWRDGAFALDDAPTPRKAARLMPAETIALEALRVALLAHGMERCVGTATTVTETGQRQDRRVTQMSRHCVTFDEWRDALRARGFRPDDKPETWRKAFQRAREALCAKGFVQCGQSLAWEISNAS